MLVLISTDSVQRPSWALDSAPWSGEPNPIGLWAPIAPALYRGGGGAEARTPRESPPLPPTDRPRWCRKRREARRPCSTTPSSLHCCCIVTVSRRPRPRTTPAYHEITAAPWTSARYFPQQKVSFPLDLLLGDPIVLTLPSTISSIINILSI